MGRKWANLSKNRNSPPHMRLLSKDWPKTSQKSSKRAQNRPQKRPKPKCRKSSKSQNPTIAKFQFLVKKLLKFREKSSKFWWKNRENRPKSEKTVKSWALRRPPSERLAQIAPKSEKWAPKIAKMTKISKTGRNFKNGQKSSKMTKFCQKLTFFRKSTFLTKNRPKIDKMAIFRIFEKSGGALRPPLKLVRKGPA